MGPKAIIETILEDARGHRRFEIAAHAGWLLRAYGRDEAILLSQLLDAETADPGTESGCGSAERTESGDISASLVAFARSSDAIVSSIALRSAAALRDSRLWPEVLHGAADPRVVVRASAVAAASEMAGPGAASLVDAALQDSDAAVRAAAVAAVARCGSDRAYAEVARMLQSEAESRIVRGTAIATLELLEDQRLIPDLISMLGNADIWLGELARDALLRQREIALPELREVLSSLSTVPVVRGAVAILLVQLDDASSLPLLLRLVSDSSGPRNLRRGLVRSIRLIPRSWTIPVVMPLLDDDAEELRIEALWALAALGDISVLPRLEAIGDADPVTSVREVARHAFNRVRKRHGLPVADAEDPDGPIEARLGRFHLHRNRRTSAGANRVIYRLGLATSDGDEDLGAFAVDHGRPVDIAKYARAWLAKQPNAIAQLERLEMTDEEPAHVAAIHRRLATKQKLIALVVAALQELAVAHDSD